jgi:hypothetical protein
MCNSASVSESLRPTLEGPHTRREEHADEGHHRKTAVRDLHGELRGLRSQVLAPHARKAAELEGVRRTPLDEQRV